METGDQFIPALENIPYPSHPLLKNLFKSPIFLWRLGLGPLVGRMFMIMTTWGRKSGLPRRTAIEYHTFGDRTYVLAAWPQSDWYRNLRANPVLTIQTAAGPRRVKARRLVEDDELAEAFAFVKENPTMQKFWQMLGFDLTEEEFLRRKGRFHLLTFDATDEKAPPPLEADLNWVLPIVLLALVIGSILAFRQQRA